MERSIPNLICYLSKVFGLRRGDCIFTGTPKGVGPIRSGDTSARRNRRLSRARYSSRLSSQPISLALMKRIYSLQQTSTRTATTRRIPPETFLMKHTFTAHPWHGVSLGESARRSHCVYRNRSHRRSEIRDREESGLMKVDRPNKFSSQCPMLYGFLPQTYCGTHIGNYCSAKTGRSGISGDGDPLDICVLAERPIQHKGFLSPRSRFGGLRLIDRDQADDKIIAVLHQDGVYGTWSDIGACPSNLLDRLQHDFFNLQRNARRRRAQG